jgi:hypothetical protein
VTFAELLEADDSPTFKDLVEILNLCAENAIFDPTGLRSLLHVLLGCGAKDLRKETDGIRRHILPLYAAAVDDEVDVALTSAYSFRRLGYSTLPVYTTTAWRQVKEGAWTFKVGRYHALMFDDYLDFDAEAKPVGHEALDKLMQADVKIYVTGRSATWHGVGRTDCIFKPIVDSADLVRRVEERYSRRLWNQLDVGPPKLWVRLKTGLRSGWGRIRDSVARLFSKKSAKAPAARAGLHPKAANALSETGLRLFEFSRTLEDNWPLGAALGYLEAYLLLRSHDDAGAAKSFEGLQLLEMRRISYDYPETLDRRFWLGRSKEIENVLNRIFRDRKTEGLLWTARLLQKTELNMKSNLAPGDLVSKIDTSANWAMVNLEWHQETKSGQWTKLVPVLNRHRWLRWTRYLNIWMDIRWVVRVLFAATNSPARLAVAWMIFVGSFAAVYFVLHAHCGPAGTAVPADEATWLPKAVHSLLASLACGIGAGLPEDMHVCLANDHHLWIGVGQRLLTLFFVGKGIDLFISRTRGRA